MINDLEDYKYYVDHSEKWTDFARLDENVTHITQKGVFMKDDDPHIDEIALSLCGMYLFYSDSTIGEFDVDSYNAWAETGSCRKCLGVILDDNFKKWFITEEGKKAILKQIKEMN